MSDETSAEKHPVVIPSRYLASLRNRWDGHLQLHSTLTEFRESLISILTHATTAHDRWETELYNVVTRLGSTRNRSNLPKIGTQQSIEHEVQRFQVLMRRCTELLKELEEHVGNFTDQFVQAMIAIVAEFKQAPRDDPLADAETVMPTLHHPQLLEWSRDVPPEAIDSSCFTVFESAEFPLVAKGSKKFALKVTCCAIDETKAHIPMIYIGTENGMVLGINTTPLAPQADSPTNEGDTTAATSSVAETLEESTADIARLVKQRFGGTIATSVSDLRKRRSSKVNMTQIGGHLYFRGHQYAVVYLLHFSHKDVAYLASTSEDKTVRISNANTGELINVLVGCAGVVSSLQYCKPLNTLMSCSFDGHICAWDVTTGSQSAVVAKPSAPVHALYIEEVSGRVYFGTRKGHVYGLELQDSLAVEISQPRYRHEGQHYKCIHAFLPSIDAAPHVVVDRGSTAFCGGGHSATAAVVYIQSIAGFLFTGDSEGCVVQWDIVHSKFVRRFHGHIDNITSISLTSDGFLFTSSRDALVLVWNMTDGNMLRKINRHFNVVSGLLVGYLKERQSNPGQNADGSTPIHASRELVTISSEDKVTRPVMISVSADETMVVWDLHYDK